jgi:membrane-bound lytic murein transglycosylase D
MKRLGNLKSVFLLFFFLIISNFSGAVSLDILPPPDSETHITDDSIAILMSELLNDYPNITDEEFKQRLTELSGQIEYKLDPLVKERIIVGTEKYRYQSENLLGKSDIYFPIFEEYLAKYNVPHHLKYLAIIESHLNPIAKSVASAVGLWQFIPSSGKLFGLQIDNYVDERSDTHKASEAAAQLLSVLYDKYKDWSMAMAAYNCGPGRVDNAIRQANSKDYWTVRSFLPRETQNYVPYFMAQVYVGEYYLSHDLVPEKMPQDLVLTDTIIMSGGLSMFDLAKDLNISIDTLKFLNPAYRRNFIPQSAKGQIIVLPAKIVAELRGYDNALDRALSMQKNNPLKAVRRVKSMEDLHWLCRAHRCQMEDILQWNELPSGYIPNEGDLIAIRKNRSSKNISQPEVYVSKKSLEKININSLKVTSVNKDTKEANTVLVDNNTGKMNESVAEVKSGEQVKAVKKHRFQANNQSQPAALSAVPSADYNISSKVDVNKLNGYSGNISDNEVPISSEELGTIIESSYSKVKYDKADYKFQNESEFTAGTPLITPEMKSELQIIPTKDEVQPQKTNNESKSTETDILNERNRNRTLRGNESNSSVNQNNKTLTQPQATPPR